MKQNATRELHRHWNALRGDRAAPDRADIDPASMRGLLNDTFMLDASPSADYPVRLAGARVNALFLCETKGMPFPGLFHDEDRACIRALLESVVDDPTPVVAGVTAAPTARAHVDLELLLLPLGPLGGGQGRILGSLAAAVTPNWAGLIATDPMRLVSLRILQPENTVEGRGMSPAPAWRTLPLGNVKISRKLPLRQANFTLYNG